MVTQNKKKVTVGDKVQFYLGTSRVQGVVEDDRGPIGANRIHLYRIRIYNDPYDDEVIEMPEDEFDVIDPSAERNDQFSTEEIVKYLKQGGLIRILQSGMSGGKPQIHAWLRRDSLGNITHTFTPERGQLGGEVIPIRALHDHRVFEPLNESVLKFLRTFNLSQADAECVLKAVGTTDK